VGAPVAVLDPAAVLAWRMARQHLTDAAPAAEALPVVSRIAGLHAQVAASAELTLWARVRDLRPGRVAELLWEERALVRTWALRGTLHLLPAGELGLWTGAQSELRPRTEQPTWLRHHGLTAAQAAAILAAVPAALDGPPLTRAELAAEVARRAGEPVLEEKLRGGFGDLLKPSAFRGELCFAPGEGPAVRFTRPDRWLGPWTPVPGPDAAREVARRFLAAYGPATREHLARWFGMTSAPQAGRWLAALGDEAVEVEHGGRRVLLLAADVDAVQAAAPAGVVRLLPAFDQYVVGTPRDEDHAIARDDRSRVYRPQGWLSPVLLVDGRMAGTWRHEVRGAAVDVTLTPFADPGDEVRAAAEAEAARLGAFLGADPEVRWEAP
jgi:winged helix DNA-binding protein